MTVREEPKPYRLRRGVPVLPRDHGLVQVGTDPGRRVLAPRTPAVEQLLAQLARGADEPRDPDLAALVSRLLASGLLVDEPERAHRARARAEARTRLLGHPGWCATLAGLLRDHGLARVTTDGGRDSPPGDVTVLLTAGEPSRELVDALTYGGEALLLVAAIDARARLGPFVLPGSTACLRCVDAHLAVLDPSRPAMAGPGLPQPVDLPALLLQHVLLRVVAEVAAWAEGRVPRSSSATTWIDEDLAEEHRVWSRHPHCGCAWGDLLLG